MYNKEQALVKLREILKVGGGSFILAGHGTAMVLLGIRAQTRDIDAYGDLINLPRLAKPSHLVSTYGVLYDFEGEDISYYPVYPDRAVAIELEPGIWCHNAWRVIEDKRLMGRKKDLDAVREIEQWLLSK